VCGPTFACQDVLTSARISHGRAEGQCVRICACQRAGSTRRNQRLDLDKAQNGCMNLFPKPTHVSSVMHAHAFPASHRRTSLNLLLNGLVGLRWRRSPSRPTELLERLDPACRLLETHTNPLFHHLRLERTLVEGDARRIPLQDGPVHPRTVLSKPSSVSGPSLLDGRLRTRSCATCASRAKNAFPTPAPR
jgi:hypothetical protein